MQRTFDTSTAWPAEGAVADFEPPAPPEIDVDLDAGRITVAGWYETFRYELRFLERAEKQPSGCRWVERSPDPDGKQVEWEVSAAVVMAVLREAGREQDAARMTLSTAKWLESSGYHVGRDMGRRLRDEVESGRNMERLSLWPIQALLAERLAAGEALTDICHRGGFMQQRREGPKPDHSQLARRAGLRFEACSKTGKRRRARTARYDMFVRLLAALGVAPHEAGV